MKQLLTLLGAGVLAVGTLVGAAEPASAQYYRDGYHRGYGDYRHGYHGGYRHRYYGGYRHGWRHGYRGYRHGGYYGRHRYYR